MPSTASSRTDSRSPEEAFYCARCLETAARRETECGACGTPFVGSGRFERLSGRPLRAASSTPRGRAADLRRNSWFRAGSRVIYW